jgi:microcystin-dependent protein
VTAPPESHRRNFLGRMIAAVTGGAFLGGVTESVSRAEGPLQLSDAYVGEIRMFAGAFAPTGWAFCEGQILPIQDYTALYSLIGTYYGGDGVNTFALPDLRGRGPLHVGTGYVLGQMGGNEQETLNITQIPPHSHVAFARSVPGNSDSPAGRAPAKNAAGVLQYGASADTNLSSAAVTPAGASQPHNNMQPYLAISFIIALDGVYPSRS